MTALTASADDEIAGIDSRQGHGLFTYYLLKDLNKSKGDATIDELYDYLRPKVLDESREDENRDQTPQIFRSSDKAARMTL